ncbi:MAG: tyrosine-type recombinase/integrase [Moorellales bacterium]
MRGSVIKRGGTYSVVFDLPPDPETGKRRQKWIGGFRTRKEAEARLAELLVEAGKGIDFQADKVTLAEWLRRWYANHVEGKLSPTTAKSYKVIIEKHLTPALGHIPISKLQPAHIESYYRQALEAGRKDDKASKGGKLTAQTVLHHHRLLHTALEKAVKQRLIPWNPADAVDPPRPERREPAVLSEEEVEGLLEALRGTGLYIPVLLAVGTGARRGEILGLRWSDVDLERGLVTISRELVKVGSDFTFRAPKTRKSARPVPLPSFVIQELKAHRLEQKKKRFASGAKWWETGLVCCHEDGSPLDPDVLSGQFARAVKRLGLPAITFHGLRHSHATLLLKWGVHPKIIAERLGHSTTRLTLDTYSHVVPTMQKEAVELLDRRLGRQENGGAKKPAHE